MSNLTDRYENIAPKIEYLKDEIILTQAWKKAHTYVRKHNWYVDILELDCSIVDLPEKVKEWAVLLGNQTYSPDPLRVVWAPKNQKWFFPEGRDKLWYPINESNEKCEQELRPLAHLSIRDQTAATAVMLCLADAIETAQGPTEEIDFLKAQRENIYSYGNRLHCQWIPHLNKNRQAKFSWGSSKCYRKYYDDYKAFLRRPKDVCKYYSASLVPTKEIYVISLDLKKFYNNIDLNSLVEELKYLYKNYYDCYHPLQKNEDEPAFWEKIKEIFNWKWYAKDYNENDGIINNEKSALGLPQGLVASGFLANAYLIRFDRMIGGYLKGNQKEKYKADVIPNIRLLDYCRYVDDIRLVIEALPNMNLDNIKQGVCAFLNMILEEHLKELKCNKDKKIEINERKTRIISYRQLSNENNISAVMDSLQHRISGTPDAETLHLIIGELVSLLRRSDVLEDKEAKKGNSLALSRISFPHLDVNDDTLKRFSATRLVKTLRDKKRMTIHSEKVVFNEIDMSVITAGQMLDHEFETVARNLISLWSQNPSLSLLLKCGFELYPDTKLLNPVLEALELKLFSKSLEEINEKKSAEYVVSDLLRAASISIGYHHDNVYPESLNLLAFREELAAFAHKLVINENHFPWYVKQQAILFLLTNKNYGFTIQENESELKAYSLLQEAILYRVSLDPNNDFKNRLATSFIAQQINPNKQKYVTWFLSFMNGLKDEECKRQAIKIVATSRLDLLQTVLKSNRIKNLEWEYLVPPCISRVSESENFKLGINIKEFTPLLKIIRSKNNPFVQENALLLLTQEILKDDNSMEYLNNGKGVTDLKIKCDNWEMIQDPQYKGLKVEWDIENNEEILKLFTHPTWIEEKYKWMYSLGMVLRACMTGGYDFTTHTFLYTDDTEKYNGIKSTTYTRQFSIINHGKGLVEEFGPITPWLSEFLYKLLQWPGILQWEGVIQNWNAISNSGELQKLIENRLKHQRDIYGELSRTPMYTLPISRSSNSSYSKLRFAVVQPLLPQLKDFNVKDPTNWSESFRKKHRDHLASICHLISKQVDSTISARNDFNENDKSEYWDGVDFIIFPELSVHPDDIQILRGLSDKTKAHIFTGLTFVKNTPNSYPINQALWLLRSEHNSGREFISVYQGKHHMTEHEKKMGIQPHRPYQVIVELNEKNKDTIRIAGAICYDATDLSIVADLRDTSDIFIISAMNKDIQTFDNMVSYLHYHMYQPVILANTGEFGGSTVQAPFSKHQRTIAHVHGNQQIAISIFEIDPSIFKQRSKPAPFPDIKTPPAGYKGR